MSNRKPAITQEEARHVARLARLRVSDEEIERYAGQIVRVLDHARAIQELELEGVEPMSHPGDQALRLAADEVREPMAREVLMEMAPKAAAPFIEVPKVL